MSNPASWFIALWTCAVLAGATLVQCGYPGMDQSPEAFAPLSYVARLLTVPITLPGPADLRPYVLPIGLAGLLLLLACQGRASKFGNGPLTSSTERARIRTLRHHRAKAWLASVNAYPQHCRRLIDATLQMRRS